MIFGKILNGPDPFLYQKVEQTKDRGLSVVKVHVTKDGEKIKLCKMTDSHLDATIRLFERRAKEGITVGTGGGSCAEDMFYDEDTLYGEEALEVLEYDEYVKERDRRISIKKERKG